MAKGETAKKQVKKKVNSAKKSINTALRLKGYSRNFHKAKNG